jgi:hypothetical protein
MLQTMKPELYSIDGMSPKLESCRELGLVDEATIGSIYAVYEFLSNGNIFDQTWNYHKSQIQEWTEGIVAQIEMYVQDNLPPDYYDICKQAIDSKDGKSLGDLAVRALLGEPELPLYRRWTLLALLSANTYLPASQLLELFNYANQMNSGRAIARYAIRNAAFPIREVVEAGIEQYPPRLKKALQYRLEADS